MFQLQWWPTHSWRPCCPTVTFSYLMWEILMNTRPDASQMLWTSHVSVKYMYKVGMGFLWVLTFLLFVCVYQWTTWRSLWSCPRCIFSRNLKWRLLGKMTTILCFTAKVATGAPKPWTSPASWDLTGKTTGAPYTHETYQSSSSAIAQPIKGHGQLSKWEDSK